MPDSAATWFPPRNDPNELRRLTALLVGSTFCVVVGFLDDRYEWSSGPQYLAQFFAALIAIAGLIFIKHVNNPFGDGLLGGPGGLPWWAVGASDHLLVHGHDEHSQLAGRAEWAGHGRHRHSLRRAGHPHDLPRRAAPVERGHVAGDLLGATVGFLPFNFSPARIFMGSSGSFFLGFAVAALGIIGGARLATVMLVLGLPALDVAWLIYMRRRRGLSPGQGGRDHLHYRLLDKGISERTIVLGYWGFCALFGAMTLLFDDRVFKLAALINLGIVALSVLIWAAREPSKETN